MNLNIERIDNVLVWRMIMEIHENSYKNKNNSIIKEFVPIMKIGDSNEINERKNRWRRENEKFQGELNQEMKRENDSFWNEREKVWMI